MVNIISMPVMFVDFVCHVLHLPENYQLFVFGLSFESFA